MLLKSGFVDVVSRRFHARHPEGRPEEAALLATAPLPPWVTRVEHGDFLVLRWGAMADFQDDTTLARRLTEREQVLADLLGGPPERGWNEAGDTEVFAMDLETLSSAVYYSRLGEKVYRVVFIDETGEGGNSEIQSLLDWKREGRTPGGAPIRSVAIVVPGRERALLLRQRADAAEVDAIYYPDDSGRWWNPFPRFE